MYTNEDKKQILTNFLEVVQTISDKEYQERVWIRGEGTEVDDFDETSCHFFDDGDPILKKYKEYMITQTQYILLIQLRTAFETFIEKSSTYDPIKFIETKEWENIRTLAKKVLFSFNLNKT